MAVAFSSFLCGMLVLAVWGPSAPSVTADRAAGLSVGTQLPPLESELKPLFSELKTRREGSQSLANREAQLRRIDESIAKYVLGRLPQRPSSSALQDELSEALAESVNGVSLDTARRTGSPDYAFVLQDPGVPPSLYAAGYAIGYGNTYSYVVRAFARHNGSYRSVAKGSADLDSAIARARRLKSFGRHELRFLVWGLHIGSPQGLTTIVLYRFDGRSLQVLWQEDSVPAAELSFRDDDVVIHSFLRVAGKSPWPSTRRYFRQVPQGLKLLKVEHGMVH